MRNGFASGLLMGMQAARMGFDTYEKSQQLEKQKAMEEAIGNAMDAKPTETTGYTAADGAQLDAIAAAKDQNGQPYYQIGTNDGGGYTVTPNAEGAQPVELPMRKVSDFMGQRFEGQVPEAKMTAMRMQAVADAVIKKDPVTGFKLRQDAAEQGRNDTRWGWEQTRGESEMARIGRENADRELNDRIEKEVGDAFNGRLKNADGTARAAGVDDYLAASMHRASRLLDAGKVEQAGAIVKDHAAQSLIKIQLESAARKEAIAKAAAGMAAGDLTGIKDFYNRHVPDGARVTDVVKNQDGSITISRETLAGDKMAPTTLKDSGQALAVLNTFNDPMALYQWSQNEFANNLKSREVATHEKAQASTEKHQRATELIAAAGQGIKANEAKEAKAKADAAVAIFKERNPDATPAQLEAVRTGVMEAIPKTDTKFKVESGDVTSLLGDPATDSKGNPLYDPMTGRQQVNRNVAKERAFFKWMTDNGIQDTDKALALYPGLRGSGAPSAPSAAAIDYLKSHPKLAAEFDAKYGKGASAQYLK